VNVVLALRPGRRTWNCFFKVTCAIFIGGGCDNVVENNIFVDCSPKRNRIARNIYLGGKWDYIHNGTRKYQIVEKNLVDQDPQFVGTEKLDFRLNPQIQDFRLKPTSLAFKFGFKPIPIERIGLNKK